MKDSYGETTIQSLYCDTDDFRLVRTSIEHPVFKEKRSLRCHNLNLDDSGIYIEMKRKYDGVVYKRRIPCKERESETILRNPDETSQIQKELFYFSRYYRNLCPKTMILYDRRAFLDPSSDLRITFDRNVRYRMDHLDFHTSLEGKRLLPEDSVLLEIKTGTAIPLWLCRCLAQYNIRKTSLSK